MTLRSFAFVASGLLAAACGDDAASSDGTTGGGAGATAATGTSASVTGASSSTGTGGEAPTAEVHLVGRWETSSGSPRATWSGSSALARFEGTEVGVRLDGAAGLWFEIVVDGERIGTFETSGGEQVYPLATGLSDAEHAVEIVRRNEGYFGEVVFLGFEVPGGAVVPSVSPYVHRIELIGDSLTCGYGIEGDSAECGFSAETESAYTTYAMVAARDLGAAAHLVCFSGKGVHQNYGGDTNEPMPVLYPRAFTSEPQPEWDPAAFPAEVVVVNLGTNDFSAALDEAAFVADYVALLDTARSRHPSAYLLAITWAHWGAGNEALVEDAVAMFGDADTGTLRFSIDPADGLGCDYHTNVVTNAKLGALLRDTLVERLGW